jgi:porin
MKIHKPLLIGAALVAATTFDSIAEHSRFWATYSPTGHPTIGTYEWWQGETFSGEWWGARPALYNSGIDFSLTYTNNIAGNPVGGLAQGFTYTDNIYFGAAFDMDKLIGWQGATIYISALDRNGRSLSQDYIGNQFTVQQIYGNQTINFYGLVLDQKFFDDKLSIKVGRYGTGDEFATTPIYWLYMNNAIDGNIQALPVNTGFASYPNAVWGGRVMWDFAEDWYTKLGVFQVNTQRLGKMAYHGLDWSIRPDNGIILLSELGWSPEFFKRPVDVSPGPQTTADGKAIVSKTLTPTTELRGQPAHFFLGGYYSNNSYPVFGSDQTMQNSYGFYGHADFMVYQEEPGSNQGIVLWTAASLSPQQGISKLPFQINGGAFYQGLLPRRDNDIALWGFAYGLFSNVYADTVESSTTARPRGELMFEWGYRVQINKFLYVQPDVQWIIQPAGRSDIPNALVLGAQMGVVF